MESPQPHTLLDCGDTSCEARQIPTHKEPSITSVAMPRPEDLQMHDSIQANYFDRICRKSLSRFPTQTMESLAFPWLCQKIYKGVIWFRHGFVKKCQQWENWEKSPQFLPDEMRSILLYIEIRKWFLILEGLKGVNGNHENTKEHERERKMHMDGAEKKLQEYKTAWEGHEKAQDGANKKAAWTCSIAWNLHVWNAFHFSVGNPTYIPFNTARNGLCSGTKSHLKMFFSQSPRSEVQGWHVHVHGFSKS